MWLSKYEVTDVWDNDIEALFSKIVLVQDRESSSMYFFITFIVPGLYVIFHIWRNKDLLSLLLTMHMYLKLLIICLSELYKPTSYHWAWKEKSESMLPM